MKPTYKNALLSQERGAALAAGSSEVGMALVQADGSLLWANPCFGRLATTDGISPAQLAQAEQGSLRTVDGQSWRIERREIEPALLLVEIIPQNSADQIPSPVVAELDSLTGVLNRQGLEQELLRWFEAGSAQPFALVFLDLDDFKAINDEQGHLAGDERLRQIGVRLRSAVRSGDVVGRFGGDEFVVLVSGMTREEGLQPVGERLSKIGDAEENPLAVSLGSALSTEGYENPQAMLHAADRRMYAAKRAKNPE